jgi:hypothetical protein
MRKLLLSSVVLLSVIGGADAATIEAEAGADNVTLLLVAGELENGDEKKFADKAIGASEAIVLLASNGGSVTAGIEIGKAIRLKGFITLVPDNVKCASACALAWLGGRKRFVAPSGQVGFHAVYRANDGQESGFGNALVGAYLNALGLSERAIFFITGRPPNEMNWLTSEEAAKHGIEVALFEVQPAKKPNEPSAEPQGTKPRDPEKTASTQAPPDIVVGPLRGPQVGGDPALENLLDVEAASRIQERLRHLGFFFGVKDGIWGPRSRIISKRTTTCPERMSGV